MSYYATKSQLEILRVMWEAGTPLSRGDILERSTEKSWKGSSIHILLNSLLEKNLIEEAGFARAGKVWGRLYAPTISIEEYYASILQSGPAFDTEKLIGMILEWEKLDEETVSAVKELVRKARAATAEKE